MAAYLQDAMLLLLLAICFYTDLIKNRIYNTVILTGAIAGLMLNCVIHGLGGILFSLGGFFLGVALLLLPFAAGGMGAGDVKLLGMIGLIKGAGFVFPVFLLAALLGGLFSAFLLAKQGKLFPLLKEILSSIKIFLFSGLRVITLPSFVQKSGTFPEEIKGENWLPYGPALVLAAVLIHFVPAIRAYFTFHL